MTNEPSPPTPNSTVKEQNLTFVQENLTTTNEQQNRTTSEKKKLNKITFLEPNVDVFPKSQSSSSILSNRAEEYKRPSFSDTK